MDVKLEKKTLLKTAFTNKLDFYENPGTEKISLKSAKYILGVQAKTSSTDVRENLKSLSFSHWTV
jgi:hypothetical protein